MSDQPDVASCGVLWDLDGTLARIAVPRAAILSWKQELARTFAPFGWTAPFSPLLPTLEEALRRVAVMDASGADALRRRTYALLDEWESAAIEAITVIPGTASLLVRWCERGVPCAVVSNNGGPAVHRALDAVARWAVDLGLAPPVLAAVVPRGPGVSAKPSPDGLALAARALGAQAARPLRTVLVIGDAPSDWQAAAALAAVLPARVVTLAAVDGSLRWPLSESRGSGRPELPVELGLRAGELGFVE